jgi:HlyD family secretion protein
VVDLASSAAVEFDGDAPERDLLRVEPGARATVTLTATGQTLDGTVRSRATALDPATGLGAVRIALDAPGLTLGLFGTAVVHAGAESQALVVPSEAMRGAAADGAQVVVCVEGKAQVRTIAIGWRDDRTVEVRDGLAEGERIAVDHVLGLENETPIAEAP